MCQNVGVLHLGTSLGSGRKMAKALQYQSRSMQLAAKLSESTESSCAPESGESSSLLCVRLLLFAGVRCFPFNSLVVTLSTFQHVLNLCTAMVIYLYGARLGRCHKFASSGFGLQRGVEGVSSCSPDRPASNLNNAGGANWRCLHPEDLTDF